MKFDLAVHDAPLETFLSLLEGKTGVYLIHFDKALQHAKHYIGFSQNLAQRLDIHSKGDSDSCKILLACKDAGIEWRVAHVWVGEDRQFEREMKRNAQVARCCPICRPERLVYARDYMHRKRYKIA